MKKRSGRLILLLLITAAVFILTGCGGDLDTKLTVNDDLSGERQMTFTLDKSDAQNGIKGKSDEIKNDLANVLPDALTMEDHSAGGNIEIVFTLKFSDMDDYNKKVRDLYHAGGGFAPDDPVTWYKPDTVFAKGVEFEEHFNSKDLMVWFQNYLISKGYVSEKDRVHIFETTSCTYDVCGETGTASPVVVDSIKYAPFESINIYTDFNGPYDIDRKIEVVLPQSSMDFNGDEIKTFFEDRVTSDFEGEWSDRSGNAVFTISGNGLDADAVNEMMNGFCGIDDQDMFYISKEATLKYGGDKVTAGPDGFVNIANVFGESSGVAENLDLSDFIYDRSKKINLNYYVDDAEDYNGAVKFTDRSQTEVTNEGIEGEDGYKLFFNTDQPVFEVEYAYTYKYHADEMEIVLNPKRKGDISRTVNVHFTNRIEKNQLDSMKKEIEDCFQAVNGRFDTDEDMIVLKSLKSDDNGFAVTITTDVKADAGIRESDLWNIAFDADDNLAVTADTKALLPLFATMHVEDEFDTGIFSGSGIDNFTYTIKGIGKPVFDKDTENAAEKTGIDKLFGGNDHKVILTEVDPEQPVVISITGKRMSIIAAIIWGAALICLVAGVISVIIFIRNRKEDLNRPVNKAGEDNKEADSEDKSSDETAKAVASGTAPATTKKPEHGASSHVNSRTAPGAAPAVNKQPDNDQPAPEAAPKPVREAPPGSVICPGCGKILAKGTLFCGMCGYKL
ncbi:MAG: hypothetical protein K6C99_07520 [Lachnospiraceae bacterium]|nr:hypothetical protein [Lachnospiraceae bacterium]